MKKNTEKDLFDFPFDAYYKSVESNLPMIKKTKKVHSKAILKLNSTSIFSSKERELFHYLAKYEKSF